MKLVEAGDDGRDEHFLKEGRSSRNILCFIFLNKPTDGAINALSLLEMAAEFKLRLKGNFMRMADKCTRR
jgi:hypothetical protein